MNDRRNFLKQALSVGAALSIPVSNKAEAATNRINKHIKRNRREIVWNPLIYCQFDHPELEKALERCAEEIGCEIIFDTPGSPELLFHFKGYLVTIVDRNYMGYEDIWNMHCEDALDYPESTSPCLIVDNIHTMREPQNIFVSYFDLKNPNAIDAIISTVKEIKKYRRL